MLTDHPTDEEQRSGGAAVLAGLLADRPGALVLALGPDERLVPVPASLPVGAARPIDRRSGLDLVVPEDVLTVLEGVRRARVEPLVRVEARFLADPDHPSTVHFVDVRAEHGVHAVVIEARDPAELVALAERAEVSTPAVAHVERDAAGVFLDVDDETTAILGWSRDELVGRSTVAILHTDDVERAIDCWLQIRSGTDSGRIQVRLRHRDGRYVWVESTSEDRLDDPAHRCVRSQLLDISAQMAELEALHERERNLHHLAEALPIGICHLRSDRQVVHSNAALVDLLGPVGSVEQLLGSLAEVDRTLVDRAIDGSLAGRSETLEVGVPRGLDHRRCELTFRTMTNDMGGIDGVIVCAADITDRTRLQDELEHRASHDALSGCLNRAATLAALDRALRDSPLVAVAYIDLDDFKMVNDDLGHAAGDEVLRVVADRLRSVVRADDRVGRVGGDEFVVICPPGRGTVDVDVLVDRLGDALSGQVTIAGQQVSLSASIGVAIGHGDRDAEAMLSRADAAMYDAKRSGARVGGHLTVVPEGTHRDLAPVTSAGTTA